MSGQLQLFNKLEWINVLNKNFPTVIYIVI